MAKARVLSWHEPCRTFGRTIWESTQLVSKWSLAIGLSLRAWNEFYPVLVIVVLNAVQPGPQHGVVLERGTGEVADAAGQGRIVRAKSCGPWAFCLDCAHGGHETCRPLLVGCSMHWSQT